MSLQAYRPIIELMSQGALKLGVAGVARLEPPGCPAAECTTLHQYE
jgi:hypothetical protein